MPNDPKLIEAMARAICNHEDGDERHIGWHTKVAQAALDAIRDSGCMIVRWEQRQTNVDMMLAIAEARRAGYVLTGLEPPAAALAGSEP